MVFQMFFLILLCYLTFPIEKFPVCRIITISLQLVFCKSVVYSLSKIECRNKFRNNNPVLAVISNHPKEEEAFFIF
jgi:hypothetical protein